MIGIYKIKNINNNKIYIGQSINIENRWKGHIKALNNNLHNNEHLQNAWNKYGKNNFKFSIIEECSKEKLNEREIYWIAQYKSYDRENGYNMTYGGQGGLHTEETKLKISKAIIGEKNGFYGKHHTKKQKEKWSKIRKGVKPSEQSKIKMSESHKGEKAYWYGKHITAHMKQRISETHKGKKLSEEQKQKLRITSSNNKKYSLKEVNEIKERLKNGEKCSEIAKTSKMSYSVINRIKNNKYFNNYYNYNNY